MIIFALHIPEGMIYYTNQKMIVYVDQQSNFSRKRRERP